MNDRVEVPDRAGRQRLALAVVLPAGLLQQPVVRREPQAGELRERHRGDRVRRDVQPPVLAVARLRLRPDPQPLDDLSTVRAERLLARLDVLALAARGLLVAEPFEPGRLRQEPALVDLAQRPSGSRTMPLTRNRSPAFV